MIEGTRPHIVILMCNSTMNNNEGTAMDFNGTSSHKNGSTAKLNDFTKSTWLFVAAAALVMFANFQFVFAQTPIAAGYRDFDFGASVINTPTGEKPESKIWYTDGFWWGSLWSPAANSYTIHKFNLGTQSWTSTGTAIDDRGQSKADALFKSNKLYVASHIYSAIPGPASSGQEGRLYRYTYTPATDTYTLDAGFPVNVNSSVSETLVLDRDTSGQLWITWTENGKVKINRSTTDDLTWGTPFDLPGQGTDIDPDDISSIVSFAGNKIGVMWSNRNDQKAYFAVHLDADADLTWQTPEPALADVVLGNVADDHLNLKMTTDGSGNLYGVGKTRLSASESPHIFVLQRTSSGVWSKHLVGRFKNGHTRPILVLDDENGKIYVFMMSDVTSDDVIYMKSANFPDPVFPEGAGTPFIQSVTETHISNPSSTKQPLDSGTGLLVIASDQNTHDYFHNYLDLNSSGDPSISSFAPTSGAIGTTVTITGNNFTGATSVNFDGITGGAFTLVSETEIHINVPDDAKTGVITVTTVGGAASSSTTFSVLPSVTSFTPTSGFVATEVTITGNNFSDATDVMFNGIAASGFTIDSENQIRVNVPLGAATGKITVETIGGSVLSATDFTVTASTTHQFPAAHDTWVRFSGVINAGSNVAIRARTQPADTSRAYLKFDVTGVSGSILSAKLRLNVFGGSNDGGSLYLVSNNEKASATPWVESTLIWSTAPTISGTALGSAGIVNADQWVEFDVVSVITGNGTYSFGLKNNSTDDVQYHSKEATTASIRPELVIQTSGGGPAAPTITSFTPTSGAVGAQVTITGANLSGASDVKFNTTSATTFTVNSATQITATVPTGATTGLISVTTGGGTVQSATNFTVTVPTVPTITSFTPSSGIVGSVVTITGTNFTGATDVKFNTTSAITFNVNSTTQIIATVPTGATTGLISVTTGGGTGQSATNFTVTIPPAPTISSFTPITGPVGTAVTITGTDFTGASDVKFNTTSATAFTVNSATQITATVPAGATTGKISVTTSGGTVQSGPSFTVTLPPSPPTVTSFTPTSGPMTTEVTVTGTNFTGVTSVLFNTTAASSFTVDSETQLRATVPAAATSGKISVTNGAGPGQSVADFTVTAPPPAPTITLFNPTSGVVSAEVTITGTNLTGATSVKFNDTSAFLFTVDSATQIRATVPSGASTGLISVTTAGGTVLSATNFTVTGGGSGTFTFAPAHDAYVRQSDANNNFGDETELRVRKPSVSEDLRSFLKFNVTGLAGIVSSAKVRLYVTNASTAGGDMYAVSNNVLSGAAPWLESTLTWSNAPTMSGSALSTAGAVAVGQIVEFTVTSAIIGNGTYSFGLKTIITNDVIYASKEDPGNPIPELVIETIPTPPATISSFTPSSGMAGASVTITGSNYTGVSVVKFNGVTATTVTVNSATQITATVPAGATTGKISVTNEGGTGQSATDFTVGPVVSSFSPASGPEGSEVTITGINFTGATSVLFNGLAASSFTVDSPTQIKAIVPTGASAGKISVTTPAGTALSANDFSLTPSITSFTPTSAVAGTEITITGAHFTGVTAVQFNVTTAAFIVDNATQIRAVVPGAATTGKISVTNLGGSALSATDFTVLPPGPGITSFTPSTGAVGTVVTLTGTTFTGATSVQFNGTAATTFNVNSATQIVATVPTGATTGKISVTTTGGTGQSSTDFTLSPIISSFTPAGGPAATVVTITGSHFTGASSVQFNGTAAASFTINSATQIQATVPAAATTGKISVTTAGGTAQSTADFVVAPVVTSFTPASGPVNTEITITGNNFVGASAVQFNGTTATTFTIDSATQIRANVPAGATNGKISVTNIGGTTQSAADFTVIGPSIASFSPTSALVGVQITITGSNFTGATNVKFNTTSATTVTVDSDTQIRANVPAGATTGKLSVTTGGGTGLSATDFVVIPPAPVVTSFTPTNGAPGLEVTIIGSNLSAASNVAFNGVTATTYTIASATQIRVTIPAGATTGKIGVTTLGGTGLSANDFIVVPVVTSFTPTSGIVGLQVTINGSNFVAASNVQFNGVSAFFIVDSATQIRANVPAGATTGKISVTNVAGTALSANDFFMSPLISSFTPSSGQAGTVVTITGSHFTGATSVQFNGTAAASFTVNSATQIQATVSAGATTGKISVTTAGGTVQSANDFSLSSPVVSSFTPASALVGVQITITGSNFSGASSVTFNGTAATTFTVDSPTQIKANVPAGASTGKIGVTTGGGTGLSATDFVVIPPTPVVSSFTPELGPTSTEVTITGSNLAAASSVQFGGVEAASFIVDSGTQIRAVVPTGALTGKISVTTLGGTGQSATNFTAQPIVSSFTPTSGLASSEVTITGNNFFGTTTVKFNTSSAFFLIDSATQIRATVPAGATAGTISVTSLAGTGTSAATFTYIPPTPTISSFTPASGLVGSEVTVTGANFTLVSSVKFNGVDATSFTVDSQTQLRGTVPAGATSGKISITTLGGTILSATDYTITSPVITSFTPTSGLVGAQITITGVNFTGASDVKFNTTSASTFTVDSATQIRANVPAGASTGKISVTTGGGTALSATDFTVIPPTPTISSFTPTSGQSGVEVTITGTNFVSVSSVQFNGTAATTFTVVSATQIKASVPAAATAGKISVVTLGGTAQSASDFFVTPVITSFTPSSGAVGSEVTITGNNFTGATSVKFNGVSGFFLVDSSTQVRATVPAAATSGKISVTTAGGTGLSATDYTLAPLISSFTPASGVAETQVTITGNHFTGVTAVTFNGTAASTFTVDSATQIRATVATGASTGKIGVTTPGGTGLSANNFTILAPTITSFTPATGLVGAEVTITGANFTGASSVQFNATEATTFTVDSPTQIRANVPAGATTGKISVTTGGGTVLSAANFVMTPVISSFSPTNGLSGTEVTVTGSHFSGATSVKFNNTTASFTVDSNTQIRATVPVGASTGKISVTTPGGIALSAADFSVSPAGITSFTPTTGNIGTEVTITGTNFAGVTSVQFNGVAASLFSVDTPTQIRATVPTGATTGKISVATGAGTALSAIDFTLTTSISSFTPTSGLAGSQVTITGSHFTAVSAVQFNGTAAASFTIDSDTQIRATVPSAATTGKISVTNAAGTALSATDFTILSPTITSFTPASGLVGIQVTITGNNLSGASSVTFNGEAATTYIVDSATQIRATVPATATTGKISVTTGGGTAQSANNFTVIPPAPVISSFTPTSGTIGSEVTIAGSNFTGATSVKFNGLSASTYTIDSATQIRATVPAGATFGQISVTTLGGTAVSTGNYTVLPAVISFTPAIGVVGTEVTITGSSFTGATNVKFNGVGALFIADSDTQIRANVPAAATTGKISVTTIAGTALSATDFAMVPTLTSFTPIIGAVGTEVTITGTHFNGSTDVKFNGTSASSFTVDSNTSIRATVPAGATTGKISVTAPGGVVQSAGNFSMIPTIASFTPTFGLVGNEVTITGTHFTGATSVKFNGTTATTFTVDSNTSIRANVPAGTTTGKISVTTAGGTALSTDDFIMTPIIASFTPASGVAGTEVTITGTHFTGATAVQFNGAAASTFTVDSATQIRATAPASATTGKLSVTTAGGTAFSATDFSMSSPAITSFTPTSGLVGVEVTITGANFSGASSVQFNGTAATTFTVDSNTQVRATVPTGATTGKISLTTGGGAAISTNDFIMTPVIASFTPTSGIVGNEVTITGNHFTNATSVKFNTGEATVFTVDSNTQIRATVPATAATGKISLTTAGGTAVSIADFTILAPTLTSFAPASAGVGSEATITGTNLSGASIVKFNGTAATIFTVDSPTQIRANVPGGASSGKISVTTPGGEVLSANNFIITPAITSFAPSSGVAGTEVTITGTTLTIITSVKFNGVAAFFLLDSDTQIRATVPAAAATGKISVTSVDGTALSPTDFTVIPPTPVITSFTPTTGNVATVVTLTGSHFTGATAVAFNGTAATTFTVNSDTQIHATVPAGATTGKISVTTAGGTGLSTTDFAMISSIASFTPANGAVGVEVTITGNHFTGATSVSFNGSLATTFTVDSNTQIHANVPTGATTGKIGVTTAGGTALSATDFFLTPIIISFNPLAGLAGTEVTITGSHFGGTTSVQFNGVAAALFAIDSPTQIRATAPAIATTGKISVTTPGGTVLSANDFLVNSPGITSFTPASGFVGTEVTITGNNLTGASSVKFNGTEASAFTVDSATQLRATVAAGTTTGKISLTTGGGTVISTNDFIMSAVIASFTPSSGVVGVEVTITGSHFAGATAVKFNTVLASTFTVDSATQIRATVAPGTTTGKIGVTTSGGESLSATDFTVLPPSITSFTPFTGSIGVEVTITGNNFIGASAVQFNGTAATTFTIDSNTQIRANVPTGATTGKISVVTGGGTAQSATNFGVLPTITSFSPASALVGTEVTITGSHFIGATSVKFNTAGALFIVDSFTQIRANVPAAATNGKISVTTTGGTGLSTTDFLVVPPPPTLASFTPTSGLVGSEVTITGSNYSNVTEIQFNGLSTTTFTIDSPTTIRVTVPVGATNGKIRVTTLGGTILSATDFTVIPPDPGITAFTPPVGSVGTEVTISGTNFTSVTSVQFNGTAASTYTVDSVTQIRANVPSGATSGKISVTNTGGTVLSANNFLLLPIFTSFTPSSGLAGSEVTITGNHFNGTTKVNFNGTSSTFTVDSNTQIRANVPANATSGKIGVITPADTAFSATDFTISSPAITSFTPAGALVGGQVTITGSNFSGASSVKFNGLEAASYIIDSATQIRATVPAAATTGKLSVTTGGGTALSTDDFTIIPPAPIVTSFTPATGAAGTEVTITGSNFSNASDVKFGGVSAPTFTVDSATQIRANVPTAALTGKISVTTLGGTALSTNDFTVPPVIISFTPTSGLIATEITITGANFTGITSVKFNGTAAAYLVDSSTQIRANVPSGSTNGKLSVTNSIGTALSATDFTVIPPPPIVSSFTPTSSLIGVEITITGNHFLNASSVKFNTTSSITFTVDSNTQIRATVPNGATTGKISVTTTGGTGLSATNFTVIPVGPAISSFTPLIGAVGTQVTITGVNFIGATAVQFNGTAATTFTVDSDTQIRANVPSGATSGKIGVTGPGGTGLSVADFTMTPVIASFTPASGIAGVEATITGSHFTGATAVQFNGTAAASFTVDSATQIRATLSASGTSGKISVTTAGGTVQSTNDFAVLGPTIASFSPTSSLVGVEVTITGSNFTGASNVSFNGTAAVYTVDSATQIRATVPAATTGKIGVTTSGGSVLSSNNFTVIPPAPVVTSFTPTSGPTALEVTIAGSNFSGASAVSFNGTIATYTVDSATQIRANVPATATTGKISVTTAGGVAQSTNDFTVSSPSIASFSPLIGLIGSEVTITGSSLSGATSVKFNGTSAISFAVDSPTQIHATVPAGATTGKISVTTSGGTATSVGDFTITTGVTTTTMSVPLYDAYVRLATPTSNFGTVTSMRLRDSGGDKLYSYLKFDVTGISGPIASAKLRMRVTEASVNGGSVYSVSNNYNGTSTPWTQSGINWNNAPAISGSPLSSLSAVSLDAIVEFDVTAALTGNGIISFGMMTTSSDMAQYSSQEGLMKPELIVEYGTGALPVPTISSFTPTSGGIGAEVTITGTNFVGASSVKFNGVSASTFIVNSATQIIANVPAGATTGKISVTSAGGTALSAANFTVTTPPTTPTISSFTPASGVAGTEVTVTGTNFTGATDVKFNTASASSFTVDSATQLRATVSASATTGKISVTNASGTGLSATDFTFIPPAPTVASFTPTSGVVGTQVTVTGTNFTGVSNVKFNTTTAPTFTVDSATQLRANVPAGATLGKISVTTPGGTALSATDFTVTVPPAPSIASFTPTSGSAGTEVTITGAEFTGATAVQFSGVAASTFTMDSNTQIRANVPAGATTGKIGVTTGGGSVNSVDDFTIAVGGGTVTERTVPQYDTYVRLATPTSNFGTTTAIRLRKSAADDLNSYLKFEVANINGPVISAKLRLSVTNASTDGGEVYAVSNFYKSTTTPWTQTGLNWNNAPVISGSPLSAQGPVSIGQIAEFDVTAAITGNGSFSFGLSNNSTDDVHFSSQEGATKPELLVEYSTGAPVAPTISSFSPTSGAVGTEVTVAGANFSGATSVKFNGVSASTFTIDSATQIRANVPSGATTGQVSVTTSGGTGTSSGNFTITAPPSPPTVTSFTPTSGIVGTQVTIIGTNFTGATSVQFNATVAGTFTVDSATQIRANVPSGATTGKISVTTAGGTVQSAADFSVTGGGTVTLTFNPGEDSYVQLTTPTTNYGSSSGIRAKKTGTEEQRAYLKFSLSGITGSVVSATLRLKVTNASPDGGSAYKVSNNYVSTSTPWNEDDINWSNAPSVTGSPLSSVGAVAVGNVAEFNVTSAITGNTQISFAITNNSSNDVQFNSMESAVHPELVIVISSPSAAREDGFADSQAEALPTEFSLSPNYPNPFNARTTIEYALPEAVHVRLAIYNSLGQLVRKVVDEEQSAGYKSATWDGTDEHGRAVGSGLYFYRLDAGSHRMNGRMILQQ